MSTADMIAQANDILDFHADGHTNHFTVDNDLRYAIALLLLSIANNYDRQVNGV